MKKTLFSIIFLFTALNITSSFAAISKNNLQNSYNFIQAPKFASYFKVSGKQFFMYIDISTPKEETANIRIITPKDNPAYKAVKPKVKRQTWIINNNGTKTPVAKGNSFVILGN